MLKRLSSSFGTQLFLIVCSTLVLAVVPLAYVAVNSMAVFGNYAADMNKEQLLKVSKTALVQNVIEQAKYHDEIFRRIMACSSLMARQSSQIYNNMEMFASISENPFLFEVNPENGIYFTPPTDSVVTAYWGGSNLTPEIEVEINALHHLDEVLIEARRLVKECIATHLITITGIGRYYTENPDAKRNVYHLPPVSEFDLRDGEPLVVFKKNETTVSQTRWTTPYRDDVIDGLMMTAATSIVDKEGVFRGITGIDVPLDSIVHEILAVPEGKRSSGSGVKLSFLVDQNSGLIAFPESYFNFFGFNIDMASFKYSRDVLNYHLYDSLIPEVRKAGNEILTIADHGLYEFVLDDETYLLAVSRFETLGWYFCTLTREGDLVSSVLDTQKALGKSLKEMKEKHIVHAVFVLFLIVSGIYVAVKLFISPIKELTEATLNVADGKFELSTIKRDDEIGLLSKAFNRMVTQLKASSEFEKEYSGKLKDEIKERTRELEIKNLELLKSQEELEQKVEIRTNELRKLNEHLIATEERERKKIADDLHDSVTQTLALTIAKLKNINEANESDGISDHELLEIQENLLTAMREIRLLSYQISPPILYDFDLEIALGWLCEDINLRYQMKLIYMNHIKGRVTLEESFKENLFKMVRELIMNVIKHSKTDTAWITISNPENLLEISVEDNGIGFDEKSVDNEKRWGFGIFSISERLRMLGGDFLLKTHPGEGTSVILKVPVKQGVTNE